MSEMRSEYRGYDVRVGNHGTYFASPAALDLAIRKYLPASPAQLQAIVSERTSGELDFSDVYTVTELLFVLAEWDYSEFSFRGERA